MSLTARCLHGAGVYVIPSPANNDRPLALRHGPLAAVSSLLIVAKVLALGVIALTPASAELSTITASRIVQLTNAERAKAGLPELATSSLLTNAAVQKGQHMLDEDYFAHISPSGVTPWFWMAKVGYTYQVAGENLAIDFLEAEDVVAAWLASPTHKENMLHAAYTQTGVGVVTGEFEGGTSTIVVHMFGLPPGATSPAPATAPAVKAETSSKTSPTPTPQPTQSPSPSPTAIPTPADTAPPRVPRIALQPPDATVQDSLTASIEGEAGSTVHFLANNQARGQVKLDGQGKATYKLSLADVSDGIIVLRFYASDTSQNQSDLSDPLTLHKDTAGPSLAREAATFVLSPTTDAPTVLLAVAGSDHTSLDLTYADTTITASANKPVVFPLTSAILSLTLRDAANNTTTIENINLAPEFSVTEDSELSVPLKFRTLTRRLSAAIFTVLSILLVLAILIRIRIQRPVLIAHASLVILLAATFFFL